MINKKNGTLWMRFILYFYGIEGELDEYKEKEINRIGNNAYMIMFLYNLIATFFCFNTFDQFDEKYLLLLILSNTFVGLFLVPLYIGFTTHALGLTDIDVDELDYPKLKKSAIIRSLRGGLFFGVSMFIFDVVTDFIFDGTSIKIGLTDVSNLVYWFVIGGIYGIILTIFRLRKLKKALKQSQE